MKTLKHPVTFVTEYRSTAYHIQGLFRRAGFRVTTGVVPGALHPSDGYAHEKRNKKYDPEGLNTEKYFITVYPPCSPAEYNAVPFRE